MAFTAVNLNRTMEFISPQDPDKDNSTKFIIGFLDADTKAAIDDKLSVVSIYDQSMEGIAKRTNFAATQLGYLRFGLKDVVNLIDDQGNPVEFKTKKIKQGGKEYDIVDDSVINAIPANIRLEVALKIQVVNEFTKEEAGN